MAELKKRILVVDDDADVRMYLRDVLAHAGYEVLEVSDGEEALTFLEKNTVDLLITDRSMPRLGGLELLAKLKERKIIVPSLVVSAYGEESFWTQAIGSGAVDYLLKPFKSEDVLKIVHKTLQDEKTS